MLRLMAGGSHILVDMIGMFYVSGRSVFTNYVFRETVKQVDVEGVYISCAY